MIEAIVICGLELKVLNIVIGFAFTSFIIEFVAMWFPSRFWSLDEHGCQARQDLEAIPCRRPSNCQNGRDKQGPYSGENIAGNLLPELPGRVPHTRETKNARRGSRFCRWYQKLRWWCLRDRVGYKWYDKKLLSWWCLRDRVGYTKYFVARRYLKLINLIKNLKFKAKEMKGNHTKQTEGTTEKERKGNQKR